MPYPKNFAVRLIICVVGFLVIFHGICFLMDTFVRHQAFDFRPIWNVAIPVIGGVVQAMNWKDPAEKAKERELKAKQDEKSDDSGQDTE